MLSFHFQDAELEAQRYRGTEMDAMLAEKEKKLAERDAYIIDLQIACGSGGVTNEVLLPNEELKVYFIAVSRNPTNPGVTRSILF